MVSSDYPIADYVVKLLMLEAARCYQNYDQQGLTWVQELLSYLTDRWEILRRK